MFCRHLIAAILALRDYLIAHPPSIRRTVIGEAVRAQPQRKLAARPAYIVFGPQYISTRWTTVPYAIPPRRLLLEALGDQEELATAIVALIFICGYKHLRRMRAFAVVNRQSTLFCTLFR